MISYHAAGTYANWTLTGMANGNTRLGGLVVKWRKGAGLSQANLADAMGTQQATISKFESGAYKLSVEQLLSILNSCGLTLGEVADDIERASKATDKPLWERIDE